MQEGLFGSTAEMGIFETRSGQRHDEIEESDSRSYEICSGTIQNKEEAFGGHLFRLTALDDQDEKGEVYWKLRNCSVTVFLLLDPDSIFLAETTLLPPEEAIRSGSFKETPIPGVPK